MSEKTIFHCEECGKKLRLENWRTEKNPNGTRVKFVDAWCVNEGCSRKHDIAAIDLTLHAQ
jgi:hypothetical protein